MSAPEKVCEFVAHSVPIDATFHSPRRVMYVCKTHNMQDFTPDSTVNEFGAYTLCPIGKIEYAVQRGLERIEDRLQEHLRKTSL